MDPIIPLIPDPATGSAAGHKSTPVVRNSPTEPIGESDTAFVIGDGFAPIPLALAKKIQALEFVDFAELLPDNRELLRRMEATDKSQSSASQSKSKLRQVSSITSWAQCFMAFAAILLSAHPEMLVDLMAYGKLVMREAARHGGEGWKLYDTLFRQMKAAKKSLPWSELNGTLYATTFLAMRENGTQCSSCMESDHLVQDCAIAPLGQQHTPGSASTSQTVGSKQVPKKTRSGISS